jgi:hypothetical protein
VGRSSMGAGGVVVSGRRVASSSSSSSSSEQQRAAAAAGVDALARQSWRTGRVRRRRRRRRRSSSASHGFNTPPATCRFGQFPGRRRCISLVGLHRAPAPTPPSTLGSLLCTCCRLIAVWNLYYYYLMAHVSRPPFTPPASPRLHSPRPRCKHSASAPGSAPPRRRTQTESDSTPAQ